MIIDIINGDCVEVLKTLPTNSVDLAICDPPYGGLLNHDWDKIRHYRTWTERWIDETLRVLTDQASIYVWCSIGEKSTSLIDIATVLRDKAILRDMIVWAKQRGRGNRKGWLFTREECLWATKTKSYRWNVDAQYSTIKYHESWIKRLGKENNPYKRATNVWVDIEEPTIEAARVTGGRGKRVVLHPAQKPVVAITRIILAHTGFGDVVLDPFLGSGTTAIASLQTGRRCIGIESDKAYCDLSEKRVADWKNPFIRKSLALAGERVAER